MFEVDKVIWDLKKSIEEQGINKQQVQDYLSFLQSESPKEYGIKEIFLSILSYFGIKNLLSDIFKNLFSEAKNLDFEQINNFSASVYNFYSQNTRQIYITVALVLFILVIYLSIKVIYLLANIDSLHKNSQRIFVLKRIEEIWSFKPNEDIKSIKEAVEESNRQNNLIFVNLPRSKSSFDADLEEAMGNSVGYYFQFISKLKWLNWIDFSSIKEWFLGELFPLIFNLLTVFFSFFVNYLFSDSKDYIFCVLMVIVTLTLVFLYFIYYFAQLDKLEGFNQEKKFKIEEAKEFSYKLESRKVKKIRTMCAIIFQLIVTVISTWCFCTLFQFTFLPFRIQYLNFLPILLIFIITVVGFYKKVEQTNQSDL